MSKTKSTQPKEFKKLLKSHTNEAYKAYVKAQKNYSSVLKEFINQEIAFKGDFEERYDQSVIYCLENQFLPYWMYLKDLNNEIKVFEGMIGDYELELLNPEDFEEDSN